MDGVTRRTGRTMRSGGRLLLLASCCAAMACEHTSPADPDVRPGGQSINVSIRRVNDSTIAYDLVASDTTPIVRIVSVLESFTGDTFGPSVWNFRAVAETTVVSPPRYNVHFSDTLPSRYFSAYYRWAVFTENQAGRGLSRDGRFYSGSTKFTASVAGIPDTIPHVGLDLVVATRGPNPVRALRAFIDSGTAAEQSFGPIPADSAIFKSGDVNRDFHLWITGPMTNGPHALTFQARDSLGQMATYTQKVVVAVPERVYQVTPMVIDQAVDVSPNDINNAGAVAITATFADSTTAAYRWANGVAISLSGPASSSADAINAAGDVAGYVGRVRGTSGSGSPTDSMVVWRGTARTALAPGFGWLRAVAIADDGTTLVREATLFRGASATNLPLVGALDMNNSGISVGYRLDFFSEQAVGARPEQFRVPLPYNIFASPLPYNHCCFATANFINDNGQILGTYENGFYIADGNSASWTINPLGRGSVEAVSRGDKVLSRLADGSIAVWTIGGPTTRVVLTDSGWTIDALRGINDSGQIIAHGVNKATGRQAALLLNPM